jgi:hypothetical protein
VVIAPDRGAEGGDTVVNKKDDWHRERRIGKAVKAGIKCFCGSEAYRDILEVTMNCETFPRVHRIFCPNCGLQMRSPAGNDDDFIVRQWRDIIDLHQRQKVDDAGMREVRINLNDFVRFKLTDFGRRIYSHRLNEVLKYLPGIDRSNVGLVEDSEGYARMQLHAFMNMFGPQLINGAPVPVERLEIIYDIPETTRPA